MELLRNVILDRILIRRTKVQQADVLALPPRCVLVMVQPRAAYDMWLHDCWCVSLHDCWCVSLWLHDVIYLFVITS